VAFLPDKASSSWRALRDAGERFCINILSAEQERECRLIATRKESKFDGIDWFDSCHGNPVLEGAVAYIDCVRDLVHEAGDHHIVVGRVERLEVLCSRYPLLFFRGGYGSFRPLSMAGRDADLLGQLRQVDLIRPTMEQLADRLETEVTAMCLVGNELVIAAAAGHGPRNTSPQRVGQRWPFFPPLGAAIAAQGDDATRAVWLEGLAPGSDDYREANGQLERVRRDGCVVSVGAPNQVAPIAMARILDGADAVVGKSTIRAALAGGAAEYNPDWLASVDEADLYTVSAAVKTSDGEPVCALTVWGPREARSLSFTLRVIDETREAARQAGRAVDLEGRP
ncbi:MAG: flavin reductase family protein, partial [Actinomycetota bacterium]|nr:flavin reductase family protein [Actinomycetota bacterium]